MVKYTYFTPEGLVGRTSELGEEYAYSVVGERVAAGFQATSRFIDDGKGNRWPVVTFSDCAGRVWCIYEFTR